MQNVVGAVAVWGFLVPLNALAQSVAVMPPIEDTPPVAVVPPVEATSSVEATRSRPNQTAPVVARDDDDLVVLKDGSRYRGVIVETIPNERITIVIAKETVRQIAMRDVVYAGPRKTGPAMTTIAVGTSSPAVSSMGAQSKAGAAKPREALVHFQAVTPGLVVWVSPISQTSSSANGTSFERLCEAPCTRSMALGSYRIAYSQGTEAPIVSRTRIDIRRETWLEGEIASRRGLRTFGWVTFGLGIGAGLFTFSKAAQSDSYGTARTKYLYGGFGSLGVAFAIGLPLGLWSDSAVVVKLAPPSRAATSGDGASNAFNGLAFTGRF